MLQCGLISWVYMGFPYPATENTLIEFHWAHQIKLSFGATSRNLSNFHPAASTPHNTYMSNSYVIDRPMHVPEMGVVAAAW